MAREQSSDLAALMMESVLQDIRIALRGMRKSPGFALVCIVTLALGIGANTAIFTVMNGVLTRPVPGIVHPNEIVTLERLQKNNPDYVFGYPDYLDYQSQNHSFAGLAGRCRTRLTLNHGSTELIIGELVSGNYFSVLGVQPTMGRVIEPADVQTEGQAPVAILSYGLWQRAFGSDGGILGKNIQVNGSSFTVIGVAAPEFNGTVIGSRTDVWLPLTMQAAAIPRMSAGILQSRNAGWVGIFGRLKAGVQLAEARSETQTIAARLAVVYPESNEHRGADVIPSFGMDPDDRGTLERFFELLLASVGLLLLIASSNVANLLLSRSEARRRETAMRLALGATRGRLIQQLLTEGVLLSLLAAGLGLLLAPWTASLIVAFRQPSYAVRNVTTTPDLRVLAFTIAVAVFTGIFFALAPALHSSKTDLVTSLKDGAPGSGRHSRLRGILVTSQIGVALLLLVTSGVVLRKLQTVLTQNPGFTTTNVVMMSVSPSIQGYSEVQGQRFYERVLTEVAGVPGVQSASLATTVPPNEFSTRISIFHEGQAPPPAYLAGHEFEAGLRVDADTVGPNYLKTMGIPMLQGRDFGVRDTPENPLVAIVSEKLAKVLWPNENPVGRHIEWPRTNGEGAHSPIEIVGVAADAKYRSLISDAPLLLYLPEFQLYGATENLVVRTSLEPAIILPKIRSAIASVDRTVPVYNEKTMADEIADSLWQQRMASALLGSFSILALVLAGIGLHAVVAHWAGQRTQEIGIRMALGANARDVVRLVVGHGARLAAVGGVIGLAASLAVTRGVSLLLFGTNAMELTTMILIAGLLTVVVVLACYVPARRATRIDPMVALRHE